MKFKVKAYDINELLSNCLPDSNKDNIIFQLEKREIWLLHRTYKHNDIISVTDPAVIRYLKKLYVNELNLLEEVNETNDGPWTVVTGANAGDGTATEISRGNWQMTGPNDGDDDGWIYVKKQFPLGANVVFNFSWDTPDDGGCCDWVIANVDSYEPNGIPSHGIDESEAINTSTPFTGSVTLTALPGEWISFGIYSTDSCCGAGFVNFSIVENY